MPSWRETLKRVEKLVKERNDLLDERDFLLKELSLRDAIDPDKVKDLKENDEKTDE